MTEDPELKAITTVYEALKDLEQSAQNRVLKWLQSKFSVQASSLVNEPMSDEKKNFSAFESIADLMGIAHARTDSDRVLLTAAFLQEKFQKPELAGREINRELHHLGHRVANITNTISSLMNKRPQLMIQTKKEGKSQQAQKKYRVTVEGIKAANEILSGNEN